MTEQDSTKLREHAARCRRLARATYDKGTSEVLKQLAVDFDEEADKAQPASGAEAQRNA